MNTRPQILVVMALLLLCRGASAGYVPMPMPISKSIAAADVIVVASVTKRVEKAPVALLAPGVGAPHELALGDLPKLSISVQPSDYHFSTVRTVKGDVGDEFDLSLPFISAYYYGGNRFDVPIHARVLLLLKKNDAKQLVPVDPLMPLIPLAGDDRTAPALVDPDTGALGILLASLDDRAARPTLLFILHEVKDDRMVAAIGKYANDDRLDVRSNVLYCLAVNQDVSAIPKIAALIDEATQKKAGGMKAVGGLSLYTTREAVPELNKLIGAGDDFVRLNAIMALSRLANSGSEPFLMDALEKDDAQQLVSYYAYATLHQLEPSLGKPQSREYFLGHRDVEVQLLKQWWEWEQIKGKKFAATQAATTQSQ